MKKDLCRFIRGTGQVSICGNSRYFFSYNQVMRLQFIVCKVMQREAYYCAARSPNIVDVVVMRQGLHNEPEKLRREVQKALDVTSDIQGRPYDASLLGYGLCSNGIVGLIGEDTDSCAEGTRLHNAIAGVEGQIQGIL